MRWSTVLLGLAAAFTATALPAAGEERAFFGGLEARMIGPYRGGRAMVAVGVHQDSHVYYMGTPGGIGAVMDPPQFLKEGDVVRCEIDRLGAIEASFKAEE